MAENESTVRASVNALAFILMIAVGIGVFLILSALYGFLLLFLAGAVGWWIIPAGLILPAVGVYIIDRVDKARTRAERQ